jgi:hypothetical protein
VVAGCVTADALSLKDKTLVMMYSPLLYLWMLTKMGNAKAKGDNDCSDWVATFRLN